jgi:hypothetical protein
LFNLSLLVFDRARKALILSDDLAVAFRADCTARLFAAVDLRATALRARTSFLRAASNAFLSLSSVFCKRAKTSFAFSTAGETAGLETAGDEVAFLASEDFATDLRGDFLMADFRFAAVFLFIGVLRFAGAFARATFARPDIAFLFAVAISQFSNVITGIPQD